jgi:hypothetical protein
MTAAALRTNRIRTDVRFHRCPLFGLTANRAAAYRSPTRAFGLSGTTSDTPGGCWTAEGRRVEDRIRLAAATIYQALIEPS